MSNSAPSFTVCACADVVNGRAKKTAPAPPIALSISRRFISPPPFLGRRSDRSGRSGRGTLLMSVRIRPEPEVGAHNPPPVGQPFGLEDQEGDDDRSEDDVAEGVEGGGEVGEHGAQRLAERPKRLRDDGDDRGAVERAEDGPEP